jgi:hypothetical protein
MVAHFGAPDRILFVLRSTAASPAEVLRELEKLAGRLGIKVRHEPFDARVIEGKGGLCWVRGVATVMLDGGAPAIDKIGVLAEALSYFDVEALYVPPILRHRIALRRRARSA